MIGNTWVIGFGHKARHGKDSAARYIHEAYPEETRIYSFASALKAYCRVAYGMTTKDAPLLQRIGLQFRQDHNPDFWVDILRAQILEEQPEVALITDVRFANEIAFCDYTVRVQRWLEDDKQGYRRYVADDRPADHPSEIALDDYEDWSAGLEIVDGRLDRLKVLAIECYEVLREHHTYTNQQAKEAA